MGQKSKTKDKTENGFVLGAEITALAWAFFVFVSYLKKYPVSPSKTLDILIPSQIPLPSLPLLLQYVGAFLLTVLFYVGAAGIGKWALEKARLNFHSFLESLVFAIGLGLGFISYFTLALGFIGGYYRPVFWGVLVLGSVLGFIRLRKTPVLTALASLFKQSPRFVVRAFLLIFLLLDIAMALVPELFYDALVYHLGIPNLYLLEHRIVNVPVIAANYPFTFQMLYLFGLALHNEMVTKLIHLFAGISVILCLQALAERHNLSKVGALAGLFFLSIVTVQINIWSSGMDIGLTLFALLSVYAFHNYAETPDNNRGWLVLTGIFAGLACGSKYQGGFVLIALLGALIALNIKKPKELFISVFTVGIIATVVFSPWLIKNWEFTGNPVYPFLAKFFPATDLTVEQLAHLRSENNGYIPKTMGQILLLPWTLTMSHISSLSFQGPLFLALFFFLAFALIKERPSWAKPLGYFCVIYFVLGLSITRLTRYVMPGMAVLAFFLAWGMETVSGSKALSYVKGIFLLLFFWLQFQSALGILNRTYVPLDVLTGRESRADYVSYTHSGLNPNPSPPIFDDMKRLMGPEDRVFFIGEEKAYRCPVKHLYSGVFKNNHMVTWSNVVNTPTDLFNRFKEAGLTHLYLNVAESYRLAGYGLFDWTEDGLATFCRFWQNHVRLIHQETPQEKLFNAQNQLSLYKIVDAAEATQSPAPSNPLIHIYAKTYFEKKGVTNVAEKLVFFKKLASVYPDVTIFRLWVDYLSKGGEI